MHTFLRRGLLAVGLSAALCITGLIGLADDANAADASQFRAGHIIDDTIFTNSGSMTAAQIQGFLDQKNSTCLKNFQALSLHDDNGDGVVQDSTTEPYGPGTMTAAELIAAASRIYRINPQVILATLEKEQGLVQRGDCPSWRYNTALGYGCPDSAPCDQSAFGFTRQIDYGSYHFRGFYDDSLPSVPFGTGNQTIRYNPDSACGSSVVNILNRATASLYSYTPYQPNAATLAAAPGQVVHCGAYGNINFWRYFTDWFGSTYAPNYLWSYAGQTLYTDSSKTQTVDSTVTSLRPGGRYYVVLKARNIGNMGWQQGSIKLGTSRNTDRGSALYDSTWLTPGRPATITEATVSPGDIGTFEFWVNIPTGGVDLREYFNVVQDGVTWLNDIGMHLVIRTTGTYAWLYAGQTLYTDSSKTQTVNSYATSLKPGGKYYAVLRAQNNGNTTWYKGNFRLGTSRGADRNSALHDPTWISSGRVATINEDVIAPGETGTFEFWVNIPTSGVDLREYFNPVQENITWLNDIGMNYVIRTTGNYSWSFDGQALYTNSSKTTPVDYYTTALTPSGRYYAVVRAKNTGNTTWYQGNFRLGASRPGDRSTVLHDPTWISSGRAATLVESVIQPGETGTFEFWINVPAGNVDLREYFNPVQENITWLNDIGMHYVINNF